MMSKHIFMKKIVYILIFLIFILSMTAISAKEDLNETISTDMNIENPAYKDPILGNNEYDGDWDDEEECIVAYNWESFDVILENGTIVEKSVIPDFKDIQKKNGYHFTFSDAYIPNSTIKYGQDILLPITSSFRGYYMMLSGGSWPETDKYTAVEVYIDDQPTLSTTITNGRHTVKINRNTEIDVGVHDIKVVLSKNIVEKRPVYWLSQKSNEFIISSVIHSTLNVTKSNIYLNMENTYSKENHSAPITTNVKNENGENLNGIKIDFYKNNEYIGSALSDENGNATLNYFIPYDSTGKYNITSLLEDNENHFNATFASNIIINNDIHTKLNTNNLTMYYKDGHKFVCQLTELDGTPIINETLIIEINGVNYTRTTDNNGLAFLAINLNPKEYEIKTRFTSNRYLPCNSTNKVTVKNTIISNDLTKDYRDNNQFDAIFLNKQGEKLEEKEVIFNINGIEYKRMAYYGNARLNINLLPGNYIITSFNPETGEKYSNNITVRDSIIIKSNDLIKYYKSESQFKINIYDDKLFNSPEYLDQDFIIINDTDEELIDSNGPPYYTYNVKFNINGVIYEKRSQNRNIALDINLEPGEYIITTDYNGFKKSNKITVLPVLSAGDLEKTYGNNEKFNVNLVNGEGQPYANRNITFNVNGVLYNRTTNNHGIASLNINLMPGEYIITSSYNGSSISNKITIKN